MITVLIVDDHSMVRAGLQQLLSSDPDIDVVGTAANGSESVQLAKELRPQVVLMDLQMPVMDGVAATAELRQDNPDVAVVIVTSFSDRDRIIGAVDAGAVGYLLKDASPDEILAGVHAAARGESPLHPRAARELLSARSEQPNRSEVELTAREVEVIGLVRAGLSNKQIARRLGISERTVKAHLTSCFQRIGVQDRTQAALWAERQGIGQNRA
jgi:DNA-binding NarL/FixJ family response regulator